MGGGGGSPPSSPPPSSGGNNKPKCEKCQVNEATTRFKLGTQTLTLCDPCHKELDRCQICKTEKDKYITAKNGSHLCEKCYYCSKCKANEAIADRVVNDFIEDVEGKRGQVLYEGAVCEVCIKELKQKAKKADKCKDCQQEIDFSKHPPMLPPWAMETVAGKTKPIMCWDCIQKRTKEEKQKQPPKSSTQTTSPSPHFCKSFNKELPWQREGDKIATNHIYLKIYDLNRNTEKHGSFCRPCAEEFKRQHSQTCSQCGKHEWPEIKKGWALDFENQTIFCSYGCRCAWLEKQTNNSNGINPYGSHVPGGISGATYPDIELFPDEVEFDYDKDKEDLEKEADKKEIFKFKELNKELKQKLDNKSKELSEKDKQLAEYYLKLAENSKKKAEKDFEKKYGKSELEALLANSNQEQQPKKNYLPLAIGIGLGVIGLIGGSVYYFWIKKKPLK